MKRVILISVIALASAAVIAAATLHRHVGYVDGAKCAAETPATPAAYCSLKKNEAPQCRCISRPEYAATAYRWCVNGGTDAEKVCLKGYQHDLSAPPRDIHRFTVFVDSNHKDVTLVASDSVRLHVMTRD